MSRPPTPKLTADHLADIAELLDEPGQPLRILPLGTITVGEGGPDQGAQQMSVFSDYENGGAQAAGDLIEANVYQEQIIGTAFSVEEPKHASHGDLAPNLAMVIAGRQTEGRGRLKRHWLSDDGGLYFTMVLRPDIPVRLSSRVNFLASLTLAHLLRESFQIDAAVKWPNDILVDGLKISGMLSELEAETDRVLFINIGMGINVNNDPSVAEPGASSLKKITGQEISKKILLKI